MKIRLVFCLAILVPLPQIILRVFMGGDLSLLSSVEALSRSRHEQSQAMKDLYCWSLGLL